MSWKNSFRLFIHLISLILVWLYWIFKEARRKVSFLCTQAWHWPYLSSFRNWNIIHCLWTQWVVILKSYRSALSSGRRWHVSPYIIDLIWLNLLINLCFALSIRYNHWLRPLPLSLRLIAHRFKETRRHPRLLIAIVANRKWLHILSILVIIDSRLSMPLIDLILCILNGIAHLLIILIRAIA